MVYVQSYNLSFSFDLFWPPFVNIVEILSKVSIFGANMMSTSLIHLNDQFFVNKKLSLGV